MNAAAGSPTLTAGWVLVRPGEGGLPVRLRGQGVGEGAGVQVQVLGPLEAWVAGRPVPLGGIKQRAVLAMLALQVNQVVSIDRLIEGLWGAPPEGAVNTVQVYLSRLRKLLQEDRPNGPAAVLVRRRPGYLLELVADQVDLYRFERLAGEGAQAKGVAPGRAAALLRQALDLWRGVPLAEFVDEPFAQAAGVRLDEQRLAALQARIDADLALGRHAELVGELEALVARHPLREQLHHQLLLSLYRSGRQAEALAAYQRTRRVLAEELGIDPSRGLQQLEAAILALDRQLDWVPPAGQPTPPLPGIAAVPAETGLPAVWNVPVRNPHFVGRAELLDRLHQRLGGGEPTVVVQALYGLGGVGKTQLAIEYAHRFAADYQLVWWVDAEQPALLAGQLAALADPLGLPAGRPVAQAVGLVLAALRRRPNWLLIFDNAQRPADLAGYLPGGSGHVLVTSRHPGWGGLGGRLEVDVLARAETVVLLRRRLPDLDEALADKLAAELGDLPLAAAQAAGYLESTGLAPAAYLHRFRTRRASLLTHGEVVGYQGRLDTTWTLAVDRLGTDSPAAVALLQLAAFFAPEPIPLPLLTEHAALLAEPLRTIAADPDRLDDTVGLLVGFSLARRHGECIQLHRLVQAAIRHRLPPTEQQQGQDQVLALLAAAHPGDPDEPASWPGYTELAPHVLATGPLGDNHPASRHLLLDTIRYLHIAGDSQASRAVADQLLDRWRQRLGPDHPDTLTAASHLAAALARLGEVAPARTLGHDTVARCRRVLGPDHPTTLYAATTLTFTLDRLGELESARTLGHDTVARCRRVLGPDHPTTLLAAAALTLALARLGEVTPACRLGQDTVARCRRVLGPDHPTTLVAASILTVALAGEAAPARTLGDDTLARCRRVLGPDHLATLGAAAALTLALAELGELESARTLGHDTLARCRHPDHLTTLLAAAALTLALAELGELESARTLGQDTLARCRRMLGPDHPTTLVAAAALTAALAGLGEPAPARTLGHDTLARCRRMLGPDHLITRFVAQIVDIGPSSRGADDPGANPPLQPQ